MRKIRILALTLLALVSCVGENGISDRTGDGEGWLLMRFGSVDNSIVATKSTFSGGQESQIYNFYMFLFDANGNKIYGKWFNTDNKMSSVAAVRSASVDCWYVENKENTDGNNGCVRLKTSSGSGFKAYMLVNLDSDMVKISSELLSAGISNESDLQNFTVFLNQTVVYRNTYFPMSGKASGITVKPDVMTSSEFPLKLYRMDAKIHFMFKLGTGSDGQTVKSFEAKQWRVINVPRAAYAMASDKDCDNVPPDAGMASYSEYAKGFFNTGFVNFETYDTSGEAGFSFYMLENRQTPKNSAITAYHDRDLCEKLPDGTNRSCNVEYTLDGNEYSRPMRVFANANDFSTYVVVTGRLEMSLENDEAGQILGGDVEYVIHLGDWGYSKSDFNTCRNTEYWYTVTVNGANSIRVEVETSQGSVSDVVEDQPGYTGSVTIAKEEIALCDSHYASKTLTFHLKNFFKGGRISADNCEVDELTWLVRTPFSEGEPVRNGDQDITDGLDYKWVHFRLNKPDSDGNYSSNRRKFIARNFEESTTLRNASVNSEGDGTDGLAGYHNDGVMDIVALVKYIKKHVRQYLVNPESSAFNGSVDSGGNPDPVIRVTVFVDEFYYDSDPLTGRVSPTLWKRFVNKDDRSVHILCSSEVSKDLESRATGSVVTIQQHAIQTIYNADENYTDLETAWGLESEDEFDGKWEYWPSSGSEDQGNTDNYNGLLNTCREWGLCGRNSTSFNEGTLWGTFMAFEVDNDTPQLLSGYQYLRYSCMTRNRDNNGNGKIDRDEVRWYMASIRQLIGMYVGDGLISRSAKLYNRSPQDRESNIDEKWMQHVISSTSVVSSNDPTIVWAEEGISTGQYYGGGQNLRKATVRCVRNLGDIDARIAGGSAPETYGLDRIPQDIVQYEAGSGDVAGTFTATNLNGNALRSYTSRELPYQDERSRANRLYKKFEVYKEDTSSGVDVKFETFNENVNSDVAAGVQNRYCPDGWRTPSQMEMAMMRYYMNLRDNLITRTYWSFGPLALPSGYKDSKYGFVLDDTNISLSKISAKSTRCVRDVRVD